MLGGLPDRPLSAADLDALAAADAVVLAVPATPDSLRQDANGSRWIADVLVATDETIAALAYDDDRGWNVLDRTTAGHPTDALVESVIEYRDYDSDAAETVQEFLDTVFAAVNDHPDPEA